MSVTQTTQDPDEMLAIWLCNECYGRAFIAGFKHGVTSQTDVTAQKSTTISVKIGNSPDITLLKRTYNKTSKYKFEFFDPHGVAPNGAVDTFYVSYWGQLAGGQTCWGQRKDGEYEGSYSVSGAFENSLIYYADLRDDILVYWHEAGIYGGSSTGNNVMGVGLAYAAFDGMHEPTCKGVNTLDAIKMPLSMTVNTTKRELITLNSYNPMTATAANSINMNVAASDRSGYSGGVAFDTYAWGSYARIDQSKPYDCQEGVYTEEASPEALEDYYNSWDAHGSYRSIDEHDRTLWIGSFKGGYDGEEYIGSLKDGKYPYPSFLNIDSLPRGSFVTDAEGKHFVSMITSDMKTFNKLDGSSPDTAAGNLPGNLVYYPVAPA